jgi:uncharacterized caspase-like protein
MANYSLIAIGINRYQLIQPLNFAQDDARALGQFAVEEAQLPAEQVLLLADTSASVEDQSTAPTKDNILNWLQAGEPSDRFVPWLWFFFSGYGVSWEGADYLLPIDGNLADIPNTGIPVRWLLDILQRKEARNILVLLDINRSPGLIAASTVGAETVELAKERGINAILSSQPQQMSHESSDLGHGFFTAALLEALRYYSTDLTLEKLEGYLRDRLPELCEHHWRPPQRPSFVIPFPEVSQQLLLPGALSLSHEEQYATVSSALVEANHAQIQTNGKANDAQIATSAPIVRPNAPLLSSNSTASSAQNSDAPNLLSQIEKTSNEPLPNFQKWLAVGGGLFLLFVLAGVFLRPNPQLTDSTAPEAIAPVENGATQTQGVPAPQSSPPTAVKPILPAPEASPQKATQPVLPVPIASPPASQAGAKAPTTSGGAKAPTAIATKGAMGIDLVASVHLKNIQASRFGQAIADARKIPPNDPSYTEAQSCITRWSLAILDIARGRANQGDFGGAIAAAALVTRERPEAYQLAQQKIETWKRQAQQQKQNQAVIAAAKKLVRPAQASSYNQAISSLRAIPLGQPGYAEAKKLKEDWSKQIYAIANSRAGKAQFQPAIETAKLVPSDTPTYKAARAAIARWQKEQR